MKMKLATIFLLSGMFANSLAFGLDLEPSFYVGVEAQYNRYQGAKQITTSQNIQLKAVNNKALFGKTGASLGVFAGARLIENVGLELGYTGLMGGKFKLNNPAFQTSSLKTKSHNLYVDALGFIPMSPEVDVIATVGAGRLSTKFSGDIQQIAGKLAGAKQNLSMKSCKAELRFGLGAQYKFNENVSVRFMARHQKGNQFVKKVNSAGVSLIYQF